MSDWTREHLRRLGYVPDGKGGLMKVEDTPEPQRHINVWTNKPKDKLNATERRWLVELEARHPEAVIIPQFRLRVGNFYQPDPVHYTADFAVWHECRHVIALKCFWHLTLWEVKDKRRPYHSDELTRPKLVRKENPFVGQVMLATWTGETWTETILA
jgi:hypothetical protein